MVKFGMLPLSSYNFVQPCVNSKAPADFWLWGAKNPSDFFHATFPIPDQAYLCSFLA